MFEMPAFHEIREHTNEKQGNIYKVCMYAFNDIPPTILVQ